MSQEAAHGPWARCENEGTPVYKSRPYGGCPGGHAATTCVLTMRHSGRQELHHLCASCAPRFTWRYRQKGHGVTQHRYEPPPYTDFVAEVLDREPLDPPMTLWAFLFGSRGRRRRWWEHRFGRGVRRGEVLLG